MQVAVRLWILCINQAAEEVVIVVVVGHQTSVAEEAAEVEEISSVVTAAVENTVMPNALRDSAKHAEVGGTTHRVGTAPTSDYPPTTAKS